MRLEDILNRIVEITGDLLQMPVCSVFLLNQDDELVLSSNVGLEPELIGKARYRPGEGLPGWVIMTGEVLALPDVSRDPRFMPLDSDLEKEYPACLCAPLRIQEEVIGALSIRGPGTPLIDRQQGLLLETVSKMVAIVVEKGRLYHDMVQARELAAVALSLSGTAHYIKNIMFTTQIAEASIDRAIDKDRPIGDIVTFWRSLKDANREITKLVGNMLNYCRDEQPSYQEVDANALATRIADDIRAEAAERDVTLIVELDETIPPVQLNESAIHDALLNLLTNAVDAIPDEAPGHVWLRTNRLPDQNNFHLQVADDGIGIPESVGDRIFTLFFSTKGEEGTGIGLASTRKIIERHGGTIEYNSTEGEGTVFDVYLPLVPPSGHLTTDNTPAIQAATQTD